MTLGTETNESWRCQNKHVMAGLELQIIFLSFLFYRIGQSGDRQERQRKGGGEGGEGPIRRQLTEIEEHLPVAVLLKPVSMKLQT